MDSTVSEVLQFTRESDVKFVRLGFSDILGVQKNISIMAEELPQAFAQGVSFDAHAIAGFTDITRSDLFLLPDPVTLTVLPWRPGPGQVVRFYCDILEPDGRPFAQDTRLALKRVLERAEAMSLAPQVGAECEFYLFRTDEAGEPTMLPLDGGSYLDIAPLDKGEDIRREICLTLEEMGIAPEASHHEQGPGQNEVDFRFSDALTCADNLMTFKSVVKSIASRNGLFASFMPKPLADKAGNGLHVNISLSSGGHNLFEGAGQGGQGTAEHFIAGILGRTPEMTLFLNQLANSYERLGEYEAPRYISWSHQNRSQLVRIPAAGAEKARMELRSPDPALNPYLAFALIIAAGLDGIERQAELPPPVDADLYHAEAAAGLATLPESLEQAIGLASGSDFVRSVLGEGLHRKYVALKEAEAREFVVTANKAKYYQERDFRVL